MEKEQLVSLVTKAQQGDNAATNKLFNVFYNDLYYFALKTVKEEDLARDITQEAVLEIISTLGDLKEPAAFVTWAKQITYHQCTRYFKKKKDVLVDEDEDGNTIFDDLKEDNTEFIPDAALDKSDFKGTILAILDELPEEQRSATMMYYFDEMSIREIANIQGVSENTVKSRLNYGRKNIKSCVEKYQDETGVKLYSVGVAPLFKWVFEDFYGGGMEPTYAERMAREISNATGSVLSIESDDTDEEAIATADENNRKSLSPFVKKVISGAVAAAIFVSGVATALIITKDNDTNDLNGGNNNYNSGNNNYNSGNSVLNSGNGDDVNSDNEQDNSDDANDQTNDNSQQTSADSSGGLDYAAIIANFTESNLNTFELYINDSHTPNAAVWLNNGLGSVYSSNEEVVTITDAGKVTAVGEGSAYIIIGSMNDAMHAIYRYDVFAKAPEANLSNLPQIDGIDFAAKIENFVETSLNTTELEVGETDMPPASVWTQTGGQCYTSDATVVTIADNGTVTAQGRGTAYVIITGIGGMNEIYKYVVK